MSQSAQGEPEDVEDPAQKIKELHNYEAQSKFLTKNKTVEDYLDEKAS